MLSQIVISMRPKQWVKNLFVFAALVFTGGLQDQALIIKSIIAFIVFCGISGVVYIINDIIDKEQDKNHPIKKDRPIACGALSFKDASFSAALIGLVCFYAAWNLAAAFLAVALVYFVLMLVYCLYLRSIVLIDVIAIALGFVLRLLAGGLAIGIMSSPWSLIMTFFLAIFIALLKRRAEKMELGENAYSHRKNLTYYKKETLDYFIIIAASCTIISYGLFTFLSGKNAHLFATIPFVLYGVFRYMYLAFEKNLGEEPSAVLLEDKPMCYTVVSWAIVSALIIYFTK